MRCVFGILAFPYMAFLLPLAGDILTHTLPTAYDQHGRTMAMMDAKQLAITALERRSQADMKRSSRQMHGEQRVLAPYYALRRRYRGAQEDKAASSAVVEVAPRPVGLMDGLRLQSIRSFRTSAPPAAGVQV